MYNKILWSMVIIVVVIIGAFVFYIFSDSQKNTDPPKARIFIEDEHSAELDQELDADPNLNPFCEKEQLEELTDDEYRKYLHGMSHQKVIADEKWSFYEMTPKRINWLIEGLNIADLDDRSVYRDILLRWQQGDFSQADQDHNTIWRLQGGTIGVATGVMTAEQEESYLKKNLKHDRCSNK